MTTLLVLVLAATAWCLLPLPLAVAVGRAFRAGEVDESVRAGAAHHSVGEGVRAG